MPMRSGVYIWQTLKQVDAAHAVPDVEREQLEPQVAVAQVEGIAAIPGAAPPLLRTLTLAKAAPIRGQADVAALGKLLGVVDAGLPFLLLRIVGIVLWRQDSCWVILATSVTVGAEDGRPPFAILDVLGREEPGGHGGKGLAVVKDLLPHVAALVVALDHLDIERHGIGIRADHLAHLDQRTLMPRAPLRRSRRQHQGRRGRFGAGNQPFHGIDVRSRTNTHALYLLELKGVSAGLLPCYGKSSLLSPACRFAKERHSFRPC